MNCPGCGVDFGRELKPLLLPGCGHSVCERCVAHAIGSDLACGRCGKASTVGQWTSFAVNVSLLELSEGKGKPSFLPTSPVGTDVQRNIYDLFSQTETKGRGPPSKGLLRDRLSHFYMEERDQRHPADHSPTSIAPPDLTLPDNSDSQGLDHSQVRRRCPRHGKPADAFCFTDSVLVCLNCLLENGHKGHELADLDTSCAKAKKTLDQLFTKLRPAGTSIFRVLYQNIEETSHFLSENQRVCARKIDQFFTEIQSALARRREELLGDVR